MPLFHVTVRYQVERTIGVDAENEQAARARAREIAGTWRVASLPEAVAARQDKPDPPGLS